MGPWFTARDWRAKAAAAPIPVLAVHGVNDFSVRTDSLEWFNRRGRAGDKLVLGQWGHSSPPRGDQWRYALTAWFDRHLAGRDVETGAPVEVYLTDGTILEATDRDAADRDEVLLGDRWPLKTTPVAFHPTSDGGMEPTPPAAGSTTFAGTAAGFGQLSQEQHPGRVPPAPGVDVPQDGAIFVSRPLERELVLAGFPSVRLSASVTVPRVHLIATLYDQPPTGVATQRRRLAQCAINPELREGLDQVVTVAPAQRYDLAPSCMVMAHHLRRGHRLVLRVSTSDPDKMPVFAHDPNVTVFTGPGATQVTLPAVATPSLHRDTVRLTR
jgi:predicted acyl esterase